MSDSFFFFVIFTRERLEICRRDGEYVIDQEMIKQTQLVTCMDFLSTLELQL